MFSDWPKITIDSSANGSVSGSDSRIVTGCSHDSNCAASTRYMKISDSASACRNALAVRFSSRERPAKPVRYSDPRPSCAAAVGHLLLRRGLRRAGQHVRAHRHLPLAIQPPDVGRRLAVHERRDVLERHAAQARRRARSACAIAASEPRSVSSARRCTSVLLAAFVVGRHLIAADQQSQRVGGIGHLHAEVGGLRPIEAHRHLRLADAQRRVHVHEAGDRAGAVRPASCSPARARSKVAAPASRTRRRPDRRRRRHRRRRCRAPAASCASPARLSSAGVSLRICSMISNMSRSRSPSGFSFTYRDAVFSVPAESPATVTIV